jgi:[acyl-carrier-protein] S-malonyltransferase
MGVTAFLFPGQGSQYVGMGHDFFEAHSWARDLFALADEITGRPIADLCFNGPMETLTLTENLQPAVTAVNLVCFTALRERGVVAGAFAGHSVGEYAALAAAGVISAAEAIELTTRRGFLMQRDADRRPGAMQAVIGLEYREVEAIVELARAMGVIDIANHNSLQQVVITGESEAVAAASKFVKTKGGKAVPLAVSGAWHSPLLEEAARDFAEDLKRIEFKTPSAPVYLNVTGKGETDPSVIVEEMLKQIVSPVRWCDVILSMQADGVTHFVETGPKNVLAGLVRKTLGRGEGVIINVQDLSGVDQLLETLGS